MKLLQRCGMERVYLAIVSSTAISGSRKNSNTCSREHSIGIKIPAAAMVTASYPIHFLLGEGSSNVHDSVGDGNTLRI